MQGTTRALQRQLSTRPSNALCHVVVDAVKDRCDQRGEFRSGSFGAQEEQSELSLTHVITGVGGGTAAVSALLNRAADAGWSAPDVLAAFLDPAHMDRFHQPGSHGFRFADATALAHDPNLGEPLRQVHQHFAQAPAELPEPGQRAGGIRSDLDPHTLHRAERVATGGGSSLGLFWDFRLHQRTRA